MNNLIATQDKIAENDHNRTLWEAVCDNNDPYGVYYRKHHLLHMSRMAFHIIAKETCRRRPQYQYQYLFIGQIVGNNLIPVPGHSMSNGINVIKTDN